MQGKLYNYTIVSGHTQEFSLCIVVIVPLGTLLGVFLVYYLYERDEWDEEDNNAYMVYVLY